MPRILIVNTSRQNERKYATSIRSLLKNTSSKIVSYRHIKGFEDVALYDGIILSGQPITERSYTANIVKRDYLWIKKVEVPMIGFCAGHQILGLAYGARVIHDREAEPKGFFVAYAKKNYLKDPLFRGIHFGRHGNAFIVYNRHKDSVTNPNEFCVMADTDRCRNALMKHRKKIIYGAQFHPEDPDYYGRKHGINAATDQDSDTMVQNFEEIVLKNCKQ